MSEIRVDPIFGSLSILARERESKPIRTRAAEESATQGPCPLCPGHEGLTPPEIERVSTGEGTTRWQTRVFPNAYPSLSLEDEASDPEIAPASMDRRPGFGVHEVLVDSPNHDRPFWQLGTAEATATLRLLRSRVKELAKDKRLLYTQVFKNHRVQAGATQDHPHFQLVSMPFLPGPIQKLLESPECRVCRHLHSELAAMNADPRKRPERFLAETAHFVALADYAPTYPYEFSIYPKEHSAGFDSLADAELSELAEMNTLVIGRLERMLGAIPLNWILYTQPYPESFEVPSHWAGKSWESKLHWFIRVIPRLARHAGFEKATGIPVVNLAPEDFARSFREKGV